MYNSWELSPPVATPSMTMTFWPLFLACPSSQSFRLRIFFSQKIVQSGENRTEKTHVLRMRDENQKLPRRIGKRCYVQYKPLLYLRCGMPFCRQ